MIVALRESPLEAWKHSTNLNPLAQIFIPSMRPTASLNPHASVFNPKVRYDDSACSNNLRVYALNPLSAIFNPKSAYNLGTYPVSEESFQSFQSLDDNINILDKTPCPLDISTPNSSSVSDFENDACDDLEGPGAPRPSILSSNSVSGDVSSDEDSPQKTLHALRLKNVDKIILGHININSIRNKIHLLADMTTNRVEILLISETKLDNTFPGPQFFLHGYSQPHRLDRTAKGGGLLFYLRNDIPAKPLSLISENIECIILEITVSKKNGY